MLIKVKMPAIFGILTIFSMKDTTSENLKAKTVFTFSILIFMNNRNFMLSLVEHGKNSQGQIWVVCKGCEQNRVNSLPTSLAY